MRKRFVPSTLSGSPVALCLVGALLSARSISIVTCLALCSMLLAPCSSTQAQQPGKILRIGFLDNGTASGTAVLLEPFRQELSKLGGVREKISPSSTDLLSKSLSACLSLRRTWFV
jgi:hypothetical protein